MCLENKSLRIWTKYRKKKKYWSTEIKNKKVSRAYRSVALYGILKKLGKNIKKLEDEYWVPSDILESHSLNSTSPTMLVWYLLPRRKALLWSFQKKVRFKQSKEYFRG